MAEKDPTLKESILDALNWARGEAEPYLAWLPDALEPYAIDTIAILLLCFAIVGICKAGVDLWRRAIWVPRVFWRRVSGYEPPKNITMEEANEFVRELLEQGSSHADKLYEDIQLYSRLRTPDAGVRLQLTIAKLKKIGKEIPPISEAYFSGSDLTSGDSIVDFSSCVLRDTDFSKAILDRAIFDGAILQHSNFEFTKLDLASFRQANLRSCMFRSTDAMLADFWGADLTSANFQDALLAGARFIDDCDLCDIEFANANLNNADFEGARNLTFERLINAKTLYLAKGIPRDMETELRLKKPELFTKPEEGDLIFAHVKDEAELQHQKTYADSLLASMSEDGFQEFLSSIVPTSRKAFIERRTQLRTNISTEEFFLTLAELIRKERQNLTRQFTVSFAVKGEGYYYLDTCDPKLISHKWDDNSDLGIVTNRKTLSDMMLGRFNYDHPDPDHIFLWGGQDDVLRILGSLFSFSLNQELITNSN